MYGTVAICKTLPGRAKDVVGLTQEEPAPAGAVANYAYIMDDDPDRVIIAVIFKDKDSYSANAHSPEAEQWYGRFRAMLAEDPDWNDGEVFGPGA